MLERDSIELLRADSSHAFPLHSHECFCLGVVDRGRVRFTIGTQEKLLLPGMIFLIPSNVGVVIEPVERYGYTTICLKNTLRDAMMAYDYPAFFPALGPDGAARLTALCDAYRAGGAQQNFLAGIDALLAGHRRERPGPGPADAAVEQAKAYIRAHTHEKFDLDVLAEVVHLSKYHFIRVFKAQLGVTPHQYYIQAKIFAAKRALTQNESEADVATELNFADQSHLCRVFKRQMGISMRDFKNSYRKLR